jgi:hypothetical protein
MLPPKHLGNTLNKLANTAEDYSYASMHVDRPGLFNPAISRDYKRDFGTHPLGQTIRDAMIRKEMAKQNALDITYDPNTRLKQGGDTKLGFDPMNLKSNNFKK